MDDSDATILVGVRPARAGAGRLRHEEGRRRRRRRQHGGGRRVDGWQQRRDGWRRSDWRGRNAWRRGSRRRPCDGSRGRGLRGRASRGRGPRALRAAERRARRAARARERTAARRAPGAGPNARRRRTACSRATAARAGQNRKAGRSTAARPSARSMSAGRTRFRSTRWLACMVAACSRGDATRLGGSRAWRTRPLALPAQSAACSIRAGGRACCRQNAPTSTTAASAARDAVCVRNTDFSRVGTACVTPPPDCRAGNYCGCLAVCPVACGETDAGVGCFCPGC